MANITRVVAGVALASSVLALSACSDSTETNPSASDAPVTLTWWHNGNNDPLLTFWADVAEEFEAANPHVTIEIEAIQNEDLQRTRIPVALQSGDAPDLFQQWGGGELAQQVDAGHLMDLTDVLADDIDRLGGAVAPWSYQDKVYGLPYTFGVEGIWYRPSLFEAAGIDSEPATMDELVDAVEALKAAGITPIAVGAFDNWPAAHWWYNFALRQCSKDVLQASGISLDFSDPCFVEAGQQLEDFLAVDPFNEGFLATSAQQGATSSAGQLATGNAAMELMGHWNVFVLRGILADEGIDVDALNADLGWFPMPATTGGKGDPTAALGGGDGFSCYVDAPAECAELLAYISSDDVQRRFAEVVGGLPVAPNAASSVTDANLVELAEVAGNAGYVQLWLDTTYGNNIGTAMNAAIVEIFAGIGTAQDVVDDMTEAAANQ
ncbi:MAG: extracellular solute-binding protein [Demequinaceae bacterium]|nr:extracellular solute-binding protein [Demequinaceae bacterium]